MKRFWLNFLILNLVMAAVGWVVTDRCLHFLSITVDAKAPVTVKPSTEYGSFGFSGKGLETLTEVQPTNTKGLSLRFVGAAADFKLVEVRFSEHVVLNRCWSGAALRANEKGEVALDPAAAHWGVCPYFFAALGALELCLLIFCWLVTWLTRKDMAARWSEALIVALVLSVFVCLVVPLQTFLGNAECFSFSLGELTLDLLPRAVMVAAVAFVLLWIGGKFAGRFWIAVVVAFVAYEYLETGILSIGNPTLDGDAIVYKGLVRGAWDAAVLVVLSAALFLARNTKAPVWTALAVLVLSLCSLLDSRKEKESSFKSDLVDHPTPNAEVIKSTVFSAKKNVMLIFLDSISTPHVQDVLSQSEELRNAFEGFTFCTNNVGMYHDTENSIPAIMTGRYHDVNEKDFVSEIFSSKSLLKTYLEKGAKITFQPGCRSYGFTTQASVAASEVKESNSSESPLYRRMVDQQQWNVYEIAKFRLTPYALKYYVYSLEIYGWGEPKICYDESVVFSVVANAPVDEVSNLAFLSFHTTGAHAPYQKNRYGMIDRTVRYGYGGRFEMTWYALSQVNQMFEDLKKRGLYDGATILLLADHGGEPLSADRAIENLSMLPARSVPFLMFKPARARGALRFESKPTSHAKIYGLVRELAMRDIPDAEMLNSLILEKRIFQKKLGSIWYEYEIGSTLGEFKWRRINDFELAKIDVGREYSFSSRNKPPIETIAEGDQGMLYEGVHLFQPPIAMVVSTGVPNADFEVELGYWLIICKETGAVDRCFLRVTDCNSDGKAEVSVGSGSREIKHLTLRVRSDAKGYIRFSLVSTGFYGLQTIRVSQAEK